MAGDSQSIAELLQTVPNESVEGLLVTFDALVGVSAEGLRSLAAQCLEPRMSEAEEQEDDDDDADTGGMDTLRAEFDRCADWLSQTGERGPSPQCRGGRLAATLFRHDDQLAAWLPLLLAAVAARMPDF